LLRDDVCITGADSIDEMLTLMPGLPDLDLVLLDASMPGMQNFEGLQRIVEKLPYVPVVVTSPIESPTHVAAAIRNGARGYFSLSTEPHVLKHALPLILSGEYYIPASVLRPVHADALLARESGAARMRTAESGLTFRQSQIVVLLAEGKSNKEIAREFKVLEGTVKLHVKGILRKLGVRNRTEAVVAAARNGYLPKGTLGIEATVHASSAANADRKISRVDALSPPTEPEAEKMRSAGAPPKRRLGRPRTPVA
jgi:DNA-binding NarL/FixJ family response regulator